MTGAFGNRYMFAIVTSLGAAINTETLEAVTVDTRGAAPLSSASKMSSNDARACFLGRPPLRAHEINDTNRPLTNAHVSN